MADTLPGVKVTQITEGAASTPPSTSLSPCVAGVRNRVYSEYEVPSGNSIPVDPGAVLDLSSMKLGIKDGLVFVAEAAPDAQPILGGFDVQSQLPAQAGDILRLVGPSVPDISYTVKSVSNGVITLTEGIRSGSTITLLELYRYSDKAVWLSNSKFTFDASGTFITVGVKLHPRRPGTMVVSGFARRRDNSGMYVIANTNDLHVLGEKSPLNPIYSIAEAALLASGGKGPVYAFVTKDDSEESFAEAREAFATKDETYFLVNGSTSPKIAAESFAYVSASDQMFKLCFASTEIPLFKEIIRGRKA